MTAITEKQKLLDKQRQEIEEIERNSDREVSYSPESVSAKFVLLTAFDTATFDCLGSIQLTVFMCLSL